MPISVTASSAASPWNTNHNSGRTNSFKGVLPTMKCPNGSLQRTQRPSNETAALVFDLACGSVASRERLSLWFPLVRFPSWRTGNLILTRTFLDETYLGSSPRSLISPFRQSYPCVPYPLLH